MWLVTSQKSPDHLLERLQGHLGLECNNHNGKCKLGHKPFSPLPSSVHIFPLLLHLSLSRSGLHLHPPAGEVVTCPNGTFGTPPSCSCVEDNTAYFGNNARVGSSNPQSSRAACARSCREHPECQFWTWGKGSPMGPCYLKHSRDNVSPGLNSYVSGSKLCVLPEGGKPDLLILLGGRSISGMGWDTWWWWLMHACLLICLPFENIFISVKLRCFMSQEVQSDCYWQRLINCEKLLFLDKN